MSSPDGELQEKDFIQEGYKKNPFPFWIWLTVIALLTALIWGGNSWYYGKLDRTFDKNPFLQVTNREMSLFLWQNPQYMRINSKNKEAYLTGFQYVNSVAPIVDKADAYVTAPPEVLFLYHTWDRLVSQEGSQRPITAGLFRRFLQHSQEWLPANWNQAPSAYAQFLQRLPDLADDQILSTRDLPKEVQMAFQGWQNYFSDAEEINRTQPTYEQMAAFLRQAPHYARNYWRNIFMATTPDYLKTASQGTASPTAPIPRGELEPMLRVAFFNWLKANPPAPKPQAEPEPAPEQEPASEKESAAGSL